jgi:hypothetical protein
MNEGQATIDGVTYELPRPFFVLATQNPADHQGTYPLPEYPFTGVGPLRSMRHIHLPIFNENLTRSFPLNLACA